MSSQTRHPIALPDYKINPPYGGSTLDWIRFFMSPYKWRLFFYFMVNVVRQSLFLSQPLFFSYLIRLLETGQAQENPAYIATLIAVFASVSFLVFASIYIVVPSGRTMDLISKNLSLFGFEHYTKLSENWHENRASGEKLQRLVTARRDIFRFVIDAYWRLGPIPAVFIALGASMFALDVSFIYIAMICAMAITYCVVSYIVGNWMGKYFAVYNQTQEKVIGGVYEFIVSTATMRFFNLKTHAMQKAMDLELPNHQARVKALKMVFWRWLFINCSVLIWMVPIISLASYQAINGTIAISTFSAIVFFVLYLWSTLEPLAMAYIDLIEQWEGIKRLTFVLNEKPDIEDLKDAQDLDPRNADIHFNRVQFHYQEGKRIVDEFDLHVKAKEKIGLIGSSGAGKSTIIKLLMRFYDVERGTIFIDGHDIKTVTRESLQNSIAVIPQDVVLFNHPLIENIRYGNLNASDEAVFEAARKANADAFIQELPDRYNTLVGERGVKLSGGQRQRIAIARAILKDAPILILDEATSALDSESEKYIQDSLKTLMDGKTVIAIAHRLSTISSLDRLVVMDQGRIIEQGSHDMLLKRKGLYAKLWSMQSGGFICE